MESKVRKQMYLGIEQERRIKQIAESSGVSEAEVVRKAIDQYVVRPVVVQRDPAAWEDELTYLRERAQQQGSAPLGWTREELHER
jgi:hypothetical protein